MHVDADTLFRGVADAMPDSADFLTVDELQQGLTALQAKYPDLVRLRTAGTSAAGFPITECQIAHGKRHALLFGFPHPNEPIGSMMLHDSIVPIKKLATVQLLTALYAMGHVQKP